MPAKRSPKAKEENEESKVSTSWKKMTDDDVKNSNEDSGTETKNKTGAENDYASDDENIDDDELDSDSDDAAIEDEEKSKEDVEKEEDEDMEFDEDNNSENKNEYEDTHLEGEQEQEAEDKPEESPANSNKISLLEGDPSKDDLLNKERCMRKVIVKRLHRNTIESHIRKHFSSCGDIESLEINDKIGEAYIVFKDLNGSQAALELHNSILNDTNIFVDPGLKRSKLKPELTIVLSNGDGLTKLEPSTITKVFSQCGEIENMMIVCEKDVLAFVTFKNLESLENALKLSGTKEGDLQIEISRYGGKAQKTKVLVKNIEKSVTETELTNMFKTCGDIVKVSFRKFDRQPSSAVIQFANQDSYCKAFALHGEHLKGRNVYLEPFLETFKNKTTNLKPKKRPHFKYNKKKPVPTQWKKRKMS